VRSAKNGSGDEKRLTLALVGNLQREDLNPLEQARAIESLRQMGKNRAEIAEMIGREKSFINIRQALLAIEPEIQELFANRKLPFSAAVVYPLKSIEDSETRLRLARGFALRNTSTRYIQIACNRICLGQMPYKPIKKRPEMTPAEEEKSAGGGARWERLTMLRGALTWSSIAAMLQKICKGCPLSEDASEKVCRECPLVLMVEGLAKSADS